MAAATTGSLRSLREMNRLRVLEAIREGHSVSRAEIARRTGLARSTVSTLVAELQRAGIVVEQDEAARGDARATGRPPTLLSIEPSGRVVLGVHFDHPFVRVAVADLEHTILAEASRALDTDVNSGDALDAATELGFELVDKVGVDRGHVLGAGVALAGPLDRETGLVAAGGVLAGWRGLSVGEELSKRLGGIPVHVDNDANLGALAEAVLGAGRGSRELVYVMVSSGIGAGLVLDGRLYRGARGTAGELGHVLVDEQGPICRCGSRGCLETYAGGDALVELLRRSHGPDLDLESLMALARDGDPGCARAIEDAGRWIGRSVATLCNWLSVERVVVGGELASVGDLLLAPIEEAVRRYALPAVADRVEIVRGELTGRAELLGALVLVVGRSEQALSVALRTAVGT